MRRLLPALLIAATTWQASAAAPTPQGVAPDDAAEIVENLLGLDPARHATPLAAMQGREVLYARYRDAARAGGAVGWRVWLLLAHTALVHADSGTSESFSADLLPAFQAQPKAALQALADNAWLVRSGCWFLGRHFDFEGRGGAGRAEFLAAQRAGIQRALPAGSAAACLAQIEQPRRP